MRDVPYDVFLKHKDKLPDNWRKRAEHWYSEFKRVEKAAEAWKNGDIDTYGKLSFESGAATIDENDLLTGMEENPTEPKSNWCCPPFYYYTKEDTRLIAKGIEAACGVDAPGSYIA